MNIRFFSSDPRKRAKPAIDDVLNRGVDQVAVACAFMTPGGAAVIEKHVDRLRNQDSFLVVSVTPPTDLEAIEGLHYEAPGHVYTHLGVLSPVEKKVGPGLMHSKVFLARHGDRGWLWVGSHNLTASAMQGVNCEAAVVVEGQFDEPVFQDALRHLERCRDEAVLFDPLNPPPRPKAHETLILHVETGLTLPSPKWFVHLLPATTDYDKVMRPPTALWMYVYPPRSLQPGVPRPRPVAAYSGTITALNFTERHPDPGIPAEWDSADFVVQQSRGVFELTKPQPLFDSPTQCVFRVDAHEDPGVIWASKDPTPRRERVVEEVWTSELDPGFAHFFTKKSLERQRLVHRSYGSQRLTFDVHHREVSHEDLNALRSRMDLPDDAEPRYVEAQRSDEKFSFIYKAKYRV